MSAERVARLLDAAVATIREHADELTALDQAIGDGDHGLNLRRGFDAIAAAREELTALPLGPGAAEGRHGAGHEGRRRVGPALRQPADGDGQGRGRGARRSARARR